MNKAIMHINYGEITYSSYGKKTIDDICKQAADIGFDGIEFRGNLPKELESLSFKEYATQIADAKKKYGLSEILFGIGVHGCTSADKDERAKSISEALEKAKIANDLCGTTICNTFAAPLRSPISTAPGTSYEFHGSAAATQNDWDLTVDAFQQIGRELEKLGMKFGFETHMNYIHDVPGATKKLVDLIDSSAIGVNMDYGNTIYFPVRPSVEETIDLYGDKLFYTHLKNSSPVPGTGLRMATALSDGEINHRIYLAKLKEVGFNGPIGIEAPRGGDRVWFAQQDFNYFKSVCASL
ncbi:MAG: sugar phosphate isomerase/epimerase [Oscillospiraceae bacterium]|nr:sugar phosphate isomerase/epimerase [Oscillospiraceae bacterium]